MIDEIEKRSDGRIKITLYDNNTLGTERECARERRPATSTSPS